MSEIDRSQVRHVARLARLHLDDGEVDRLSVELAGILAHFEELSEVALPPEEGPSDRGLAPRQRDDVVDPDPLDVPPSEMAPEWREGFFIVPRLPALNSAEAPGEDPPE